MAGPRLDAGIAGDLYDYVARRYDPVLARFIQPDTIVPDPGDPQSLNRYSYVGNNPVRYTDPSGHLTEEQIMQYLGVDTWEEVLRFFAQGGKFAGEWGWLEAMRAADLGENIYFTAGMAALLQNGISSYSRFASSEALANASSFVGHFVEANGEILFVNNENHRVVDPAQVLQHATHEGYTVTHPSNRGEERIRRYEIERYRQYQHLRSIDWNEALNPVEIADMAKVGGAALMTGALTVAFFTTGAGLCTSVIGCVAGGELMVAGVSSGVSTWYLAKGAGLYFEHYWDNITEYTP